MSGRRQARYGLTNWRDKWPLFCYQTTLCSSWYKYKDPFRFMSLIFDQMLRLICWQHRARLQSAQRDTYIIFVGFGVTWQRPTGLHAADQLVESRHVGVAQVRPGAGTARQRLLQMLRHERCAVALLGGRQLPHHLRARAQLHPLHLSLHLLQRAHRSAGRWGEEQTRSRLYRPKKNKKQNPARRWRFEITAQCDSSNTYIGRTWTLLHHTQNNMIED